VRILPFAVVRFYVELTQAHRYALALDHEGIARRVSTVMATWTRSNTTMAAGPIPTTT
jgi:hypothetical protein